MMVVDSILPAECRERGSDSFRHDAFPQRGGKNGRRWPEDHGGSGSQGQASGTSMTWAGCRHRGRLNAS